MIGLPMIDFTVSMPRLAKRKEDGEEDGEEVGDVLEWSQDLTHVSGLQYALNHCERHP